MRVLGGGIPASREFEWSLFRRHRVSRRPSDAAVIRTCRSDSTTGGLSWSPNDEHLNLAIRFDQVNRLAGPTHRSPPAGRDLIYEILNCLLRAIETVTSLACLLGCAALSQTAGHQNEPAFRSNVEIVVIPCAVVDTNGAAVGNLTRDDFRVYDNDTRRAIESFWIDDDQPLTFGVLIDASESQKEQLSEHKETASGLLERILRPGDRAFVISVDEDVRLWADLAGPSSDVRTQLAGIPGGLFGQPCAKRPSSMPGVRPASACGTSPLWDAIYDAARLRLRALTGNKALLILTDGFDSGSTHTWHQAADAVSKADAVLYAIQYRSVFGRNFAPDLYRLVADGGGTTFSPPGDQSASGKYNPILSRIETDLRRRYVLGFRPDRLSGRVRHDIRVEVTRPNLTVRARKTYFQEQQ